MFRKRVLLLGPPASGKSTVGLALRDLVRGSGIRFVQLDDFIDSGVRTAATRGSSVSVPLVDEFIDSCVTSLMAHSITLPSCIVELAYHDHRRLIARLGAQLSSFTHVIVFRASAATLMARNSFREVRIPETYILRCWNDVESCVGKGVFSATWGNACIVLQIDGNPSQEVTRRVANFVRSGE